ncbi:MAG: TorF family putative porin [Gammaproteobacteria bacterium]|nr:TorF family putative porin [Gammaproteobacteria bacterium]
MKKTKALALTATIAGSLVSGASFAELSANATLTSNYIWRGMTLSDDGLALHGGADWAHEKGVYAGVWGSTTDDGVDTDFEYDLYAGYSAEVGKGSIDIGVIRYDLVDADGADVTEFYLGGSMGPVSATYYVDSDNDTTYVTAAYGAEVQEYGINLYIGSWGDTADGSHYGVTVSREVSGFDISATLDMVDDDLGDETFFFVMASKSWDL